MTKLSLRYGTNPHQKFAQVENPEGLPLKILNGSPSYINFLDALNAWQLVREAFVATGIPAATSFKHVSPAGSALGLPLTAAEKRVFKIGQGELSPVAAAYARARGADRMSSYGDWVATSGVIDITAAKILKRETSDGVIAPGYTAEALALLSSKKNGTYRILSVDPQYYPPDRECRQVFGVTLQQQRNSSTIGPELLTYVPTAEKDIPPEKIRDILLALTTLKYTQSNAVCIVYHGQTIGIGAGQQSRVHCTKLAVDKARAWHLRFHPALRKVRFRSGVRRHDRDTWEMQFVGGVQTTDNTWLQNQVENMPASLTENEQFDWLSSQNGGVLASDGFFPHPDSIGVARRCGIRYVVQPGGSQRDEDLIKVCDEEGLVMVMTGQRLFHH